MSDLSTTVLHDTSKTLTATDFSGEFSDPNGDTLQSITITSLPTHGTLTLGGANVSVNQTISASNLTLTYTPTAGYAGADSFQWNASDGNLSAASSANVSINVTDQAPTLSNVTIGAPTRSANQLSLLTTGRSKLPGLFSAPTPQSPDGVLRILAEPSNNNNSCPESQ